MDIRVDFSLRGGSELDAEKGAKLQSEAHQDADSRSAPVAVSLVGLRQLDSRGLSSLKNLSSAAL